MVFLDTGDPNQIYDLIDRGGVVAALVIALFVTLVGSTRQWWAPGWYVRRLEEKIAQLEQEIKQLTQSSMSMTERIIDVVQRGRYDRP
jgi:tryptophan 2,3-dioxygenase